MEMQEFCDLVSEAIYTEIDIIESFKEVPNDSGKTTEYTLKSGEKYLVTISKP